MEGTRATGVEYVKDIGQRATAEREVILAAGTFATPQLRCCPASGPHLREMGSAALADLPVGKNLQIICLFFHGHAGPATPENADRMGSP
jgi:choline dehydrogenase-like flavoprotein